MKDVIESALMSFVNIMLMACNYSMIKHMEYGPNFYKDLFVLIVLMPNVLLIYVH